jgi:SAM-dependent methyltransferase
MSLPGAGRAGRAGTSAGTVWDRQAGGYHRFFSQFTIPVAHPLLDAARVTAGSTVLDAGAGPGYAAWAARARGAHVAALDLPADMLACARLADPLLPLVRADAGTLLPLAGGAFTAVVAGFFLPHLGRPGRRRRRTRPRPGTRRVAGRQHLGHPGPGPPHRAAG